MASKLTHATLFAIGCGLLACVDAVPIPEKSTTLICDYEERRALACQMILDCAGLEPIEPWLTGQWSLCRVDLPEFECRVDFGGPK